MQLVLDMLKSNVLLPWRTYAYGRQRWSDIRSVDAGFEVQLLLGVIARQGYR